MAAVAPPSDTPLVEALVEDSRWEDLDLEALAERAARATLERRFPAGTADPPDSSATDAVARVMGMIHGRHR